MEIDPNSFFSQTEEEKRQTAEHECAHAVAFEVFASGVEWVSIEPTEKGPGRCKPRPAAGPTVTTVGLAACKLAGPAWDVVHYGDEEKRLQAKRAVEGDLENVLQPDFTEAHSRADDADQLEKAWKVSKMFVRDWKEIIEHLAGLLMENDADSNQDPFLYSPKIRACVIEPEEFGLEGPNPSKYHLPSS